ncbi:hypothetical protein GIS00_13560 [Nakamurella sp. YIM 132087]|uniref:Fibronectin type-III domain-containing protein n=1 Tax=Nakamurella alba TaxID=2665158 RepID=A0A7K1FLE3_9ACTN|nr:hypothetical protein [Nakamurella alba]MTD14967.1 hypothetical protein [Nakamurella alba]
MALEDSLRTVRDRLGLRVNEDLIVWAARLETGRRRSGRPGVTPEILQDTWRRMHITVSDRENQDLMTVLEQARDLEEQEVAAPAAPAAPAVPTAVPVAADPSPAPSGPPSWYTPPSRTAQPEPVAGDRHPAQAPGAQAPIPQTPNAQTPNAQSPIPQTPNAQSPIPQTATAQPPGPAAPTSLPAWYTPPGVTPEPPPLPERTVPPESTTPTAPPAALPGGATGPFAAAPAPTSTGAFVPPTADPPPHPATVSAAPGTGPTAAPPRSTDRATPDRPDHQPPTPPSQQLPSQQLPSRQMTDPEPRTAPPPTGSPTGQPLPSAQGTSPAQGTSSAHATSSAQSTLPAATPPPPPPPVRPPVTNSGPHTGAHPGGFTPPGHTGGFAKQTGPLPEPSMFAGDADVFGNVDGYIGLTVHPDRVQLMWDPADPGPGILLYLVVGTRTEIPHTADQGERLAVTADPVAVVAPGYRYYAVFAYRGASPMAAARDPQAVRQAIGQVVPGPDSVDFVVNPDSVVLEWRRPAGVTGVQLRRSRADEPLPTFEDATLVKPVEAGQSSYLDKDVEPGRSYVYELVCLAGAPRPEGGTDRSPAWSSGTVVIPAMPERVTDLQGSLSDAGTSVQCRLSWPKVARGRVSIFHRPGTPGQLGELAPDQILTAAEIDRLPLGNRIVWGLTGDGNRDVLDGFAIDVAESPEWCFTPVTEMAGRFAVGPSQVLTHVGAIGAIELTDRIFWQFLRFEWPTGAAEVIAEVDGAVTRTSRERFELYGGVRLTLPPHRGTIRLHGVRTYRGVTLRGRPAEVAYPGRQVVFYQFEYGPTGVRAVYLRPEIPLPPIGLVLGGGTDLQPLSLRELGSGTEFGTVASMTLPSDGPPGEWFRWEVTVPPQARQLKVFGHANSGEEIALVEWMAPGSPAPQRVSRRCPHCLAPPNPENQYFRCGSEGTCQPAEDTLLTRIRGTRTLAKPWTMQALESTGPVGSVHCRHCGTVTRDEFCLSCGETFPHADWWQTNSYAATLLGPRRSGKTSMLQAQSYALLEGLAESWGGYAAPLDAGSRARMKRYHDEWETGRLQLGTTSVQQNRDLLRPLQFSVRFPQQQRPVAFSLFDVAGEDMEDPELLANYSHSMLNGDALIYLVDPLQITEVRTALDGFVTLPPGGGATPVQGLHNVITVLRGRFGGTGPLPVRLAVVFSKFDALQQASSSPGSPIAGALPFGSAVLRDPYSDPAAAPVVFDPVDGNAVHQEARTLLSQLGGSSILHLVESNFATYRYFVTSSTGHTPASNTMHSTARAPHRLFDPLRWVIQG